MTTAPQPSSPPAAESADQIASCDQPKREPPVRPPLRRARKRCGATQSPEVYPLMHPIVARARIQELGNELRTKTHDGTLTHKRMDEIEAEYEQLEVVLKTYRAGTALASYAEPRPYGHGSDAPASAPRWQLPEGEGSRLAQRKWHAPSPLDMSGEQVASLFAAGRNRMTYSTRVGDDGIHNKALDGGDIHFKAPAAVAEGAPGSLIPPILLPQAFTLRLEPTRIIEYLVNGVPPTGQSVSWLQHSGNTAPAAAVAELAAKPDIGPQIVAKETSFTVVAGMASLSRQMFDDFTTAGPFIAQELYKSVVNEENAQVLTGSGVSPNQLGLLSQTGTLTRTLATPDTQIDTLVKAANDIRVGGAFADADLIILNPTDWLTIRTLKTTYGSYVLDVNDPNQLGGVDNLFGIRVATSTQCTLGKAVVLDSKVAATVWMRQGMEILSNQWGDWEFQNNAWSYRCEERFGVGVQYPQAICLVSGL